jgi:hypothetical protein
MADKTYAQATAELLRAFADIHKEVGELTIALKAQSAALYDLLPAFGSQFVLHLEDAEVLQLKREYEQRIHVLRTKADQMMPS